MKIVSIVLIALLITVNAFAETQFKIPVKFISGPNETKYTETVVTVPAREVALLIIDLTADMDPLVGDDPTPKLASVAGALKRFRGTGMKVIFVSSSPLTASSENKSLKAEIKVANINWYPEPIGVHSQVMDWPVKNPYWDVIRNVRRKKESGGQPVVDRKMSNWLAPRSNEYQIDSIEELRFVLWKEKVKVVLFAGTSLNQCVSNWHNRLAEVNKFLQIVLSDCVEAEVSPTGSVQKNFSVLLDFLAIRSAIATSTAIKVIP